jgi:DNA-binding NarL/FixJ family response regulator
MSRPKRHNPFAPALLPIPEGLRVQELGDDLVVLSYAQSGPVAAESLTEAEREVVQGVLEGKSNRAIAAERGRSARTVVNQLASAFRKLGVGSRAELAHRLAAARRP